MSDEQVFKALAHKVRRHMLDRLLEQPGMTLNELVEDAGMVRQAATKHLRQLEEAGLISGEWCGRERRHYLNPVPIQEINDRWIDKYSRHRLEALAVLKNALEDKGEA